MATSLQDILERQARLLYYMHLSISDQMDMDASEIQWMYEWLIKTRNTEMDEIKHYSDKGTKRIS